MIDEETRDMIDTFWNISKRLEILVAWQKGGVFGRHDKDDTLWAYIYSDSIGEFMHEYIYDIDCSIEAELLSCGAIAINLTKENLCYELDATDDEIWERRPEGCKEDW